MRTQSAIIIFIDFVWSHIVHNLSYNLGRKLKIERVVICIWMAFGLNTESKTISITPGIDRDLSPEKEWNFRAKI